MLKNPIFATDTLSVSIRLIFSAKEIVWFFLKVFEHKSWQIVSHFFDIWKIDDARQIMDDFGALFAIFDPT